MKLTQSEGTEKRKSTAKNNKINAAVKMTTTEWIILAVVIVAMVFILGRIISQKKDIAIKMQELSGKNDEIVIQELKNGEIDNLLNSNEADNAAYIEKSARENLDYAYKDERIFINVSGD